MIDLSLHKGELLNIQSLVDLYHHKHSDMNDGDLIARLCRGKSCHGNYVVYERFYERTASNYGNDNISKLRAWGVVYIIETYIS